MELSKIIEDSGRAVIATTLDGFHNPRRRRYERGRGSPEGYFYDAYNYQGIVENLLKPLGHDGDCKYRTQIFDLVLDQPINVERTLAPADAILIVDGSFALRQELRDYWDVRIFLSVDFNVAENRASVRDAISFGSANEARQVTRERYHGAHKLHAEKNRPTEEAHFVIQNNDPLNPKVIVERL